MHSPAAFLRGVFGGVRIELRTAAANGPDDDLPVFADPSGRRRRRFQLVAAGFGAACAANLVVLGVAFTGGPIGSLWAVWVLPLHQFLYRQLIYLIMMKSIITALTGVRLRWQKLSRVGAAAAHHHQHVDRRQLGGGTSAKAASVRSA